MIAVDLEKVLLAVCKGCNEEFSEDPCEPGCCRIRAKIEKLPRVTFDDLRPKGRWIGIGYEGYADGTPVYDYWECSECGEEVDGEDVPETHPFCHGCGADMRARTEE